MGQKALKITVATSVFSTILLAIALMQEFQTIAFSLYGFPTARIAVNLRHALFENFGAKLIKNLFQQATNAEQFNKYNSNPHHDLQDLKDTFCGLNGSFVHTGSTVTFCSQFTADYYAGLLVTTVSISVIAIQIVSCFYLAYYLSGRTKRGYRRVALTLYVIAPVMEFLALAGYCFAVAITAQNSPGVIMLTTTWTPGAGLFLTFIAVIVMLIIPCLSGRWKLTQNEFFNEARLLQKRRVEDSILDKIYQPHENLPPSFAYSNAAEYGTGSHHMLGSKAPKPEHFSYPPEATFFMARYRHDAASMAPSSSHTFALPGSRDAHIMSNYGSNGTAERFGRNVYSGCQ